MGCLPINFCNNFCNSDIQLQFNKVEILIGLKQNDRLYELNAILQCLCHIEPLVNHFKFNFSEIKRQQIYKTYKEGNNCLTDSFKKLIDQLWPDEASQRNENDLIEYSKTKSSKNILEMIYKINPNYNEIEEPLIEFILKRLHNELIQTGNKNKLNLKTVEINNKNSAFQHYLQNFQNHNKSLINDIFAWTYYTLDNKSGNNEYNFQSLFYKFYPLEQIYQFNNQNGININKINIYNCLSYEHQKQAIYSTSEILIFILSKTNLDKNINFLIEEYINQR